MKKLASLLLVFVFAAQTFDQGILLINFYMNRSGIAAKQCENRYKPMLHCNGKCVLAKKMKAREKKEQQNPELKLIGKAEVVSSRSFFVKNMAATVPVNDVYNFFPTPKIIDRSLPIFHPPA